MPGREAKVCLESRVDHAAAFPDAGGEAAFVAQAVLCVPLAVEQRCFGVFSVAFGSEHAFCTEERSFLATLAYHAAQALERARLFDEAQRTGARCDF